MKVTVSDSGLSDLDSIRKFYEAEGVPLVGQRFVVSIVEHIETLRDNPDIGRIVPEFNESKIRELIHPPFRIVYLREARSLHVIRVWRSERLLALPDEP